MGLTAGIPQITVFLDKSLVLLEDLKTVVERIAVRTQVKVLLPWGTLHTMLRRYR